MRLIPILVECCAGYKADEAPRRFCWEQHWLEVEEVLDRCFQGAGDPEGPIADYFKMAGTDRAQCLLKHDREADVWYLARRWPAQSPP